MKTQRYCPYNLDLRKELKTYKNVGKDYGNYKTANRGWIFNICRYLRKKRNKNNKKYFSCNTYSEWKNHVLDKVNRNINNYDDFIHFLIGERNRELVYKEGISLILIPIDIALIAVVIGTVTTEKISLVAIVVIALLEIIALSALDNINQAVNFYNDLIEILKK